MSSFTITQILDRLKLNLDATDPDHAVRLSQLTSLSDTLNAAMTAESARVDTKIGDDIATEASRADAKISADVQAAVDSLVSGAVPALDTLKELGDALASGDDNLSVTLTNAITQKFNEEKTRAETAEAALQTAVNAEKVRAEAAEGALQTDIAANVTDIQSNSNLISAETSRAQNAENSLQSSITANTNAITVNSSNLSAESTNRTNADVLLQTNVDAEKAAREAADILLQTNVDTEKAAREAADTLLQQNVDAEKVDREAADTTLQTNITNLSGHVDDNFLRNTNGVHTGLLTTDTQAIASYLYFGDKWRVAGSNDGSQLVFEYNKGTTAVPDYATAVPFITTMSGSSGSSGSSGGGASGPVGTFHATQQGSTLTVDNITLASEFTPSQIRVCLLVVQPNASSLSSITPSTIPTYPNNGPHGLREYLQNQPLTASAMGGYLPTVFNHGSLNSAMNSWAVVMHNVHTGEIISAVQFG